MPDTANAIGISEAADSISALLAREDGEPEAVAQQSAEAPDQGAETEAAPETTQEASEAEGEGTAEETAEEGEAEEEQPEQPQKYTVKVGGQTMEVTLEEALKGYQREADYTRKSMDLAEKRKAIESEVQTLQQERAQYAQLIPALRQQLQSAAPPEPDERLRESNPIDYLLQKTAYDNWRERSAAAEAEMQRIGALQQQEMTKAQQRMLEESNAKLAEAIPDWSDPVKGKTLKDDLRAYAKSIGFSDEELSQTYDHRAVKALYDGMRGQQLAKRMSAATPPRPAQKGPKSAAAGSASLTPGRAVEATRIKQRLAKTGSVDDAAAFFLNSGLV